jgi:hypothetical protein
MMKLTDSDKQFIIKSGDTLHKLFLNRIEDLKEEVTHLPRSTDRDSKIELIQEFRAWLKDFRAITNPEPVRKNKVV